MRKTIDALAENEDLSTFVGRVIDIVARYMVSPLVEFWSHEGDLLVRLRQTWRSGLVFEGSDVAGDPRPGGIQIPVVTVAEGTVFARRSFFLLENFAQDPIQKAVYDPLGFDLEKFAAERGVSTYLNVPLQFGNRSFGAILVYLPSDQPFTASRVRLATALVQQATLAIRLTDLADETRAVAVLREQEAASRQRVAELAKANDALRRGVERLAAEKRLEPLLTSVLTESMNALGARGGAVILLERGTEARFIVAAVVEDHAFSQDEIAADPYLARYTHLYQDDPMKLLKQLSQGKTVSLPLEEFRTRVPLAYRYHSVRGHNLLWYAPVCLSGEVLGFTIYALKETSEPIGAACEMVAALSQQLVLALELSRLAAEAQQAAVAQEHQRAAQERASELHEINSQLQTSLVRLSEGGDFQQTLESILTSARTQLEAASVCVFCLSDIGQALEVLASAGRPSETAQKLSGSSNDRLDSLPASSTRLWQELRDKREPLLHDARDDEDADWFDDDAREWHLKHACPLALGMPLNIGSSLLGYMSIAFPSEVTKSDMTAERLRVGQSMASLASMAIEADRLTRQARRAALAEERDRLAHELHDTLAGAFTGIFMQLQAVSDLPATQGDQRQACIVRAEELARQGLRQVREFVHVLTVSGDSAAFTPEAMREFVLSATNGSGTRGRFHIEGAEMRLKSSAAHSLLRIMQEAVGNTLRYAEARHIDVTLRFEQDSVQLLLSDDGKGFLIDELSDTGFGIAGMRARTNRLGGQYRIDSCPGKGTTIQVELPQPYEEKAVPQ